MPDFRSATGGGQCNFAIPKIVIVLVLLLVIESDVRQIEHEHEHEHYYEVAWTQRLATFPARERRLRRVDLLTWSSKRGRISE
jgi:hypothetical protein